MSRDQLIIQDKKVRKLRRKMQASLGDLKNTLRTWTDVSGKHKIEAKFVQRTDAEVTLKTDAGRELTLAIDRLCEEDRKLLSSQQATDENPFQ